MKKPSTSESPDEPTKCIEIIHGRHSLDPRNPKSAASTKKGCIARSAGVRRIAPMEARESESPI
eukprot:scaffold134747_cov32-Tisochrysis_lutea.AAC.1